MKRDLTTPAVVALPFPTLLAIFSAVCLMDSKLQAAGYWFTRAITIYVLLFIGMVVMDLIAPKR